MCMYTYNIYMYNYIYIYNIQNIYIYTTYIWAYHCVYRQPT